MKSFTSAILLIAGLVSAQTSTLTTNTTSLTTSCSDMPDVTITSTNTITETYCSLCTDMGTVHTTVYTTVWSDICTQTDAASNGYMTPVTYTVTESCSMPTPTWSSGPAYVPAGYTTGVAICTVCGENNVTATLTYPTSSPPAMLATTTTVECSECATMGTDSSAPAATAAPAPATSADAAPATSPDAAPAAAAATTPAATAPVATPVTSDNGYAAPTGSSPAVAGNTAGIAPYSGDATIPGMSKAAAVLALAGIAAGAFLL